MTIASAIVNKQQQVAACYTAISNKGGTLPATKDVANMPTAINSIPTGGGAVISTLAVTPTTSAQTITASGGVDGFSPVNVSAVTSSIDPNIIPENIKKDVSILNVLGTLEGGGGETLDEWLERVTLGDWVDSASSYASKGQTATAASGWGNTEQIINLPNVELISGAFATPSTPASAILLPKLKLATSAIVGSYTSPSFANLTQIELPELLVATSNVMSYSSALVKLICPKLLFVKSAVCQNLGSIQYLYIPSLVGVGSAKSSNFMTSCPKIRAIYLRDIISINNAMTGSASCADFDTLVLAGNRVVPLTNSTYITNQNYHPKFYAGTGSIYVPDALVDSYKAATNWSAVASMIKKLSTWVNPYA